MLDQLAQRVPSCGAAILAQREVLPYNRLAWGTRLARPETVADVRGGPTGAVDLEPKRLSQTGLCLVSNAQGQISTDCEMDDWRWLVSPAATWWLARVSQTGVSLAAQTASLRKHLSPTRTHLVLQLVDLRRRAAVKFANASRMFFTRRGLQQATDQEIARYKAGRFPAATSVADLCCGLGGDLLSLAARTNVVGVDRDPLAVLLAQANCRVCQPAAVEVRVAEVDQFRIEEVDAWHLDPDRRPRGRRTTRVLQHEPTPDVIDRLLDKRPSAAIKLAPASVVPPHWAAAAELEWIGHRRECQQQVAWFGPLARRPGQGVATILTAQAPRRVIGQREMQPPTSRQPARYVFEPHSAVLAARLVGALAAEHGLSSLTPGVPYLTGDQPLTDVALAAFEVTDVLPLDMKRLKSLVRSRGIGQLEIKKRGVPHDPETVRRRLRVPGPSQATLILTRVSGQATALLTRRMDR